MALAPDAATALISHPVSQLSMRQRDRHCQCTQDHGYSCVSVFCVPVFPFRAPLKSSDVTDAKT
jgi:hypothetical protein